MNPYVVVGGGEHARVVADAILASGGTLAGYADRAVAPELERRFNLPYLGDDTTTLAWAADKGVVFVLGMAGVGVSRARQKVVERYVASAARFGAVVHPRAWVSPSATVEAGAVIMAGAMVNTGARIGAHAVINTGAVIEHDCDVGAFAMVGPAAALGGGAHVGEGSYLGLGCRVRDHVHVGANTLVGMGAVVTRAVQDGVTVVGVPARARG